MSGRERGQMTVELAVVLPVIIVVMVIAIDCLVFVGQCARFDNLVPQRVLELAVSPEADGYTTAQRKAAVKEALEEDFCDWGQSVKVTCEEADSALGSSVVYTCTLRFVPWPLSAGGSTLLGSSIPVRLTHECSFAVDPYTPGDL